MIKSHTMGLVGLARASVVRTAIAMPTMPYIFPVRDVAGEERPRKAMMNMEPATR